MTSLNYPVTDWMPLVFYGDATAQLNKRILSEVISHPTELVTGKELRYMLTATEQWDETDIGPRLDELIENELVARYDQRGYSFYGLTDSGKQFLVDTGFYRGQATFKSVYEQVERPEDIEAAYNTSRPKHPPADTRDYNEQDVTDNSDWEDAQQQTYRTIRLVVNRTGDEKFRAALVDTDTNDEITTLHLTVPDVNEELTDDHSTVEYTEPRGKIGDESAYEITTEREHGTIKVQLERNGESWYDMVESCPYIFTNV